MFGKHTEVQKHTHNHCNDYNYSLANWIDGGDDNLIIYQNYPGSFFNPINLIGLLQTVTGEQYQW